MSVLLAVLAAAGLEAGWIELLDGPMGQISPIGLQRLSRETLVNIGPVVISLVYIVRCAPLLTLLFDSRRRAWRTTAATGWQRTLRRCRREFWQGLLGTGTLFVYFLITILVTVVLCKAGGQPLLLIRRILAVLQAGDIGLGLAKTWLFSGITTLVCCREGFAPDADRRPLALRLSDALLVSTLATLGTALLLVLLIHPTRL
ncbi:MAG: ABC transporter permease [Cyanobacteriota bacterium]